LVLGGSSYIQGLRSQFEQRNLWENISGGMHIAQMITKLPLHCNLFLFNNAARKKKFALGNARINLSIVFTFALSLRVGSLPAPRRNRVESEIDHLPPTARGFNS
jgi:hypothetical protein